MAATAPRWPRSGCGMMWQPSRPRIPRASTWRRLGDGDCTGCGRPVIRTLDLPVARTRPLLGIKPGFADGAVPEGGEWWILNNWHDTIERASGLERWWEWKFIRPRYDSYLLTAQTRRVNEQADASLPASGGPARARE